MCVSQTHVQLHTIKQNECHQQQLNYYSNSTCTIRHLLLKLWENGTFVHQVGSWYCELVWWWWCYLRHILESISVKNICSPLPFIWIWKRKSSVEFHFMNVWSHADLHRSCISGVWSYRGGLAQRNELVHLYLSICTNCCVLALFQLLFATLYTAKTDATGDFLYNEFYAYLWSNIFIIAIFMKQKVVYVQ